MNVEQRLKDQEFVMHLHEMARSYDSKMLRRVADRMSELIKENYENERRRTDHHD